MVHFIWYSWRWAPLGHTLSSNCQVLGISVFWAPRSRTSCPSRAEQMASELKPSHRGHTWSAWSCSAASSWEDERKALPWLLSQGHVGLSSAGLHRLHIPVLLIKLPGRASWSKQHEPEGATTEERVTLFSAGWGVLLPLQLHLRETAAVSVQKADC